MYSFEEGGVQTILSNRIQQQFRVALQEQMPNCRFQEDSPTRPIWSVFDNTSEHTYEILVEMKDRRNEKKIILRSQSVLDNDNGDIANLSKLYLILINVFLGGHLN